MEEDIYRNLARHLDRLPDGFPPSSTGADLRLLQKLFTPQEAELATHLTLDREPAGVIAERAGIAPSEAEKRLDEMAAKGLILSSRLAGGPTLYQAVPFVVGIYEYQVNNLSKELLDALHEYWRTAGPEPPVQTIPQMRTIPIHESIQVYREALPYDRVEELVQAHDRFAVTPCICRRHARLMGKGCDAPEESCLVFGHWADFYIRTGRGRAIDRAEVMEILARADAANLVLQPSNSQDVSFICCCCGCCCGILGGLKRHPRPAEAAASRYIASLEAELCQGCWTCLERCQMEALSAEGDHVALNADRCIGCGLCVSTCPSGALTLLRKPDSERTRVPATLDVTWKEISRAQAEQR